MQTEAMYLMWAFLVSFCACLHALDLQNLSWPTWFLCNLWVMKALCLHLCSSLICLFIHGVWFNSVIISGQLVWNSSTVFMDILGYKIVAPFEHVFILGLECWHYGTWILCVVFASYDCWDAIMVTYKYGILINISGTIVDLSTRVGLVVKNKAKPKVLFILVGSHTICGCSSPKSLVD